MAKGKATTEVQKHKSLRTPSQSGTTTMAHRAPCYFDMYTVTFVRYIGPDTARLKQLLKKLL